MLELRQHSPSTMATGGLLLFSAAVVLQLLVPEALALTEGGVPAYIWSDLRCLSRLEQSPNSKHVTPTHLALDFLEHYAGATPKCDNGEISRAVETAVFVVGNELRLSDSLVSPSLNDFDLKQILETSGVSIAYSVVSSAHEVKSVAESLLSGISSNSIQALGKVAVVGACGVDLGEIQDIKLQDLKEYLSARKETERPGLTDVLVVCTASEGSFNRHQLLQNKAKVFTETLSALQASGTSYVGLYTTEQQGHGEMMVRSLAEYSNVTGNVTLVCGPQCLRRAMLWENLFVVLLTLIILLGGICCMVNLQAPTRFEIAKQE